MLGKFFKDEDGHTYFIPENLISDFNKAQKEIWLSEMYGDEYWEANRLFCEQFNKYMVAYPPEHYIVDLELKDGED